MANPAVIIPRHSWCLMALSACLLLPSCQAQGEAEHLEHVAPEHKPAGYSETVVQLRQRFTEVLDGKLDEHQRTQRLAELGDIIRWLPEIAAESDLKKSEWEQVQQISLRLTAWHAELSTSPPFSPEQRRKIERDLQTLDAMIDSSDRYPAHRLKDYHHESTDTVVHFPASLTMTETKSFRGDRE